MIGELSVVGSLIYYVFSFGSAALFCKLKVNKALKTALLLVFPLLLATIRYNVGYDYGSYISGYELAADNSFESIFSTYKLGDPIGFSLLNKFSTLFNSDRAFLFFTSLFAYLPVLIIVLSDWKDKRFQSLIVFFYLFSCFIFSFSAIKQGIAMSFLLCSLKYVFDRKPIKFLILIGIAFLFHSSALVFIPVFFLWSKKEEVDTLKKIITIIVCALIIANLELLLSVFLEGRYQSYATEIVEGQNRSFFLYLLITIVCYVFRKQLIRLDKRNDLLITLMTIGVIFQILGFFNAFTKRISDYFIMVQIFLIPQLTAVFKNRNEQQFVVILEVLYAIIMFVIATPTAPSGMGFIPFGFKL